MQFDRAIRKMGEYYVRLCKQTHQLLTDETTSQLPKKCGVYVFYSGKKSEPIYVGMSKNINNRLRMHHLSRRDANANSSLCGSLVENKKITKYGDAREWLMKKCTLKYVTVEDIDEAHLLEALLISIWRDKYGLLNYKP